MIYWFQVQRLVPKDPDASKKVRECEKAITKIRFEEAIASEAEEKHSVVETLDYHSIGAYAFCVFLSVIFVRIVALLRAFFWYFLTFDSGYSG